MPHIPPAPAAFESEGWQVVSCLRCQSALVYQRVATRTTRVPPAKGKVQPGNRRERTMATSLRIRRNLDGQGRQRQET